jgi:pyrroloquinoline quinone (PQQ) biosynthesis protein C
MYGALKDLTVELFASQRVEQHALFLLLEGDRLTVDEARAIGLDIFHVVDAFPRFLAAVLTHIGDYRERMNLVENLYAEHGRMREEQVHVVTYRSFLHALGLSDAQIDASEPGLAAQAYVRALLALCGREEPAEALGALGVIEEVVARVSPIVGRYGSRGLRAGASMGSHFSVHEALDLSHADEIYRLAAHTCARGLENDVRRGIALGFYYQTRLYTDLVSSRVAPERLVEVAAHNRPAYLDLTARRLSSRSLA